VLENRRAVAQALSDAAARWAVGRPRIGVLYSGGLDSSLSALLLSKHSSITLWTLGLPGAKDLAASRSGATALGLPLREIAVSASDVLDLLATPGAGWANEPEPGRSVRLSLRLALRGCDEKSVALGQGADELFYGYARYARLRASRSTDAAGEDLRRLTVEDWPWTMRTATSLGKEIASLFLDPEVVRGARRLPPPETAFGEPPKVHLRAVARSLGLPAELADRPKRALQFGSGIERVVRRETAGRNG
jgi:asparagine synthase (glutamine-hydrolysing)